MIVLDTDTLTHLFAGRASVVTRREQETQPVVITIVTWIEVLQGRFATLLKAADGDELQRAQQRLTQTQQALSSFRVLLIAEGVKREFDRLRQDKKAKKIGRADLLIASVVLAHKATLVTRNRKDFELVAGLSIENWVD